mmetsp:Transcript_27310/g.47363  ORF Transcript_27310/g.47363 Transcript_27310/m.47363 type:complete len:242 (-) Transcript_27310:526-1251(-)
MLMPSQQIPYITQVPRSENLKSCKYQKDLVPILGVRIQDGGGARESKMFDEPQCYLELQKSGPRWFGKTQVQESRLRQSILCRVDLQYSPQDHLQVTLSKLTNQYRSLPGSHRNNAQAALVQLLATHSFAPCQSLGILLPASAASRCLQTSPPRSKRCLLIQASRLLRQSLQKNARMHRENAFSHPRTTFLVHPVSFLLLDVCLLLGSMQTSAMGKYAESRHAPCYSLCPHSLQELLACCP